MLRIIENSFNNYRVVDKEGRGIATFYKKSFAEEYIQLKEELPYFINLEHGIIMKELHEA